MHAGRRPWGLSLVVVLMILFGLAEVITGFNRNFFGVATAKTRESAYAGAIIGMLYIVAGLFVWLMKRWAATLALNTLMHFMPLRFPNIDCQRSDEFSTSGKDDDQSAR